MSGADSGLEELTRYQEVDDYSKYRKGDLDTQTGKKIDTLIVNAIDHIVYLSQEGRIEWEVTKYYKENKGDYSETYGEVIAKVTELEGRSEIFNDLSSATKQSILPIEQLREYRTLLGTAIALMLDKQKPALIREVLKKSETYLNDRMSEIARIWYLKTSSYVVALDSLALLLLWLFRTNAIVILGEAGFQVMLGALMGGLGALFSIITRSNKMHVNASSGKLVHYFEGASRVFIGMLGALIVALAIKADLFLGIINSTGSFAVLLTACTAAGASERIAPSIIKQIESSPADEPKTQKES